MVWFITIETGKNTKTETVHAESVVKVNEQTYAADGREVKVRGMIIGIEVGEQSPAEVAKTATWAGGRKA